MLTSFIYSFIIIKKSDFFSCITFEVKEQYVMYINTFVRQICQTYISHKSIREKIMRIKLHISLSEITFVVIRNSRVYKHKP